jgi:predicted alpha/beta superfamily hydrolase
VKKIEELRTPWERYPSLAMWQEIEVTGTLLVSKEVHSTQLRNRRRVLVYLPASYDGERRYPVLYMHDAQNLFDPATSYAGATWRVGETMTRLAEEGIEAIVVAMDHGGRRRIREYNPFPYWRGGRGAIYVRFVAETMKRIVDHDFRTLPERAHTAILGSSMGGLISLYAYAAYPQVFGAVGAMSPSLWVADGSMYNVVRDFFTPGGRIYLDNGPRETSAAPIAELLVQRGWRRGADLQYVYARGAHHTESAWAARLPDALRFLMEDM